jgi:hypothetical protein
MEKCELTLAQDITFFGWRWNFQQLTLRMTLATRFMLLFMVDQ